ncbi:3-oxoacyl-[acyl-carrier-protein] synthase III C-terminal domain-containing protein [Kingella oralis]|jgi:hypothetical protein|uniref:3-oxoacyl-[acyl-carrier-protein] synthase III C-terminal domain-containing protein n=1 Tax=Kingella oralis TaxID=505 RepID=UPI002D810B32|nr:3-oxoacyl-[acyl-carrier-protein] synthase III C-terminal domain-containing protein [Kingella oralis]
MNKLEIIGWGSYLPEHTVCFNAQTRHRAGAGESQLGMLVTAARRALNKAGIAAAELDCIVCAVAVGVQPIPCTAALIHEQIALGTAIPALDINSTCTSFLTALDTVSYLIAAARYDTVLIVAGDLASCALNPEQSESFKLFGDGAAAIVVRRTEAEKGVIAAEQRTWSEGAHSTEIRGGLSALPPQRYHESDPADFLFDMQGREVLKLSLQKIPALFDEFWARHGLRPEDIALVIPHQASPALPVMMKTLGFKKGQYVDAVAEYGNMVSASVPFMLCKVLEEGRLKAGDKVLLSGTAAGLTCNIVCLQL